MWSTEVGGNVHSKIRLVSSRQHRATEVQKLRFLSSCQYTHGVVRRLLGPHDTPPCVLIFQYVLPKIKRLNSASQVLELLQVFIMALSSSPVVVITEVRCNEVSDQFTDDSGNLAEFLDHYKRTQFKVSYLGQL